MSVTLTDDQVRIVCAIGVWREARATRAERRVKRLAWWVVALAVTLATSVAHHAYDRVQLADLKRGCAERAP